VNYLGLIQVAAKFSLDNSWTSTVDAEIIGTFG
jgi:hypothetical protein